MDNLEEIKISAKMLLHLKPVANKEFPFIVYHPFISQNPAPYRNENNVLDFVDIFNDNVKYIELIKQIEIQIDKSNSFESILLMLGQPYQLLFLNLNKNYLSDETFNNCLKDVWILTEFPNADKNVSVEQALELFKKADKKILMTASEQLKLKSLSDEVKIYRGIHNRGNERALSWTDDYDKAVWFAKRFDNTGYVLEATIKKDDIIAFFDGRNESELIVDFNKIYDLKKEKVIDMKIQEE